MNLTLTEIVVLMHAPLELESGWPNKTFIATQVASRFENESLTTAMTVIDKLVFKHYLAKDSDLIYTITTKGKMALNKALQELQPIALALPR